MRTPTSAINVGVNTWAWLEGTYWATEYVSDGLYGEGVAINSPLAEDVFDTPATATTSEVASGLASELASLQSSVTVSSAVEVLVMVRMLLPHSVTVTVSVTPTTSVVVERYQLESEVHTLASLAELYVKRVDSSVDVADGKIDDSVDEDTEPAVSDVLVDELSLQISLEVDVVSTDVDSTDVASNVVSADVVSTDVSLGVIVGSS